LARALALTLIGMAAIKPLSVATRQNYFLDPGTGNIFLDMYSFAGTNAIASTFNRAFAISAAGNIGLGGAASKCSFAVQQFIKKSIGFIAQELQEFFLELVSVVDGTLAGYKKISDLQAINYSGLSVLAIKAIQEQQYRMDSMEQEIDLLKAQNKMMIELISKH
jgi:hypothetical protein